MTKQARILWADDEIDLLKPHVIFLEDKGFEVVTTNSGDDALDILKKDFFDIIFLDENMPGLSGIETLSLIKDRLSNTPVVMITKNEDEAIMEEAIGSNISDYLIKPVNPNQILLCLKKNLENKELISRKAISGYQQEFRNIGMAINERMDHNGWADIYKRIVKWELDLDKSGDEGMNEALIMQKHEANNMFVRYVKQHYLEWLNNTSDTKPIMSHTAIKNTLAERISAGTPLFLFVIDNLRYDQWKMIQPLVENLYRIDREEICYSILPTSTHYARNAFFAGLLPQEIERKYPQYWRDEDEEGSKNQFEKELLGEQLKRLGKQVKYSYHKITSLEAGKKLADNINNLTDNALNVVVYNFVDMLSHARTDMEVIKELASGEKAYRSLTVSWFEHSPLMEMFRFLSERNIPIALTADHGSIRVSNPVKVLGERHTNKNLRYKIGRNLQYNPKEVYEIKRPGDAFLPKQHLSSTYIFCQNDDFFVYPNNYHHYVHFYGNTFQHGGISMEEVLVPLVFMKAK